MDRNDSCVSVVLAGYQLQLRCLPGRDTARQLDQIGDAVADSIFQSLADKAKFTIIAGLTHVSQPVKYNQARVYAPGAPVVTYEKHHMLRPFESQFKPGTTLTFLPARSGTWGVAICKDMDFTQPSRQYGKAGVGLMLVPA